LLLGCKACTSAPTVRVERRLLATLPKTYEQKSLVISDDREAYAYIVRAETGFRVVDGAGEGPLYAEVTQPWYAPGTRSLFYWSTEVVNGQPVVKLTAPGHVVVTDVVKPGPFVFSRNGRRWAAMGSTAPAPGGKRGRVEIFVDGERIGSYADACVPAFSPDAAHFAHLIEDEEGRTKLMIDGQERHTYESPRVATAPASIRSDSGPDMTSQFSVTYLADGSLLTVAHDKDGWGVFRDATRLAAYGDNIAAKTQIVTLVSPPQGFKRGAIAGGIIGTAEAAPVAVWWERPAGETERWRVVRNGTPSNIDCQRYWTAEPPAVSSDGQHVAYVCATQTAAGVDEVYAVVDDRRYGPYRNVWGMALSPDGKRFAFAADDNSSAVPWSYYVDGRARATKYDIAWPPRFSPDGKHVAWVAQRNERGILFLDGRGRASSDRVLLPPTFAGNEKLEWIVLRGRRLSRLDVTWR
jgi:hypothetical protein